jgi:hypothetical protein
VLRPDLPSNKPSTTEATSARRPAGSAALELLWALLAVAFVASSGLAALGSGMDRAIAAADGSSARDATAPAYLRTHGSVRGSLPLSPTVGASAQAGVLRVLGGTAEEAGQLIKRGLSEPGKGYAVFDLDLAALRASDPHDLSEEIQSALSTILTQVRSSDTSVRHETSFKGWNRSFEKGTRGWHFDGNDLTATVSLRGPGTDLAPGIWARGNFAALRSTRDTLESEISAIFMADAVASQTGTRHASPVQLRSIMSEQLDLLAAADAAAIRVNAGQLVIMANTRGARKLGVDALLHRRPAWSGVDRELWLTRFLVDGWRLRAEDLFQGPALQ